MNGHQVEPLAVHLDEPFAATFVSRAVARPVRPTPTSWCSATGTSAGACGSGSPSRTTASCRTRVVVELDCDSDFASVFEVKERRPSRHGRSPVELGDDGLELSDPATPGHRVVIRSPGAGVAEGRLPLGGRARSGHDVGDVHRGDASAFGGRADRDRASAAATTTMRLAAGPADGDVAGVGCPTSRRTTPTFHSRLRPLPEDLGALRIFDPEHPEPPILAAGRAVVHDRVRPRLAPHRVDDADRRPDARPRACCETLARFQGDDVDDRDRGGARQDPPRDALRRRRPVSPSAGATSTTARSTPRRCSSCCSASCGGGVARRTTSSTGSCLTPTARSSGSTHFGDRDGDGYVEYAAPQPARPGQPGLEGLLGRASASPTARWPTAPIALCEVQGYVYAAYLARAHLASEAGDTGDVRALPRQASDLRRRFNEDFWLDELGTLRARPSTATSGPSTRVASNIGHCLWTGIVDPAAGRVGRRPAARRRPVLRLGHPHARGVAWPPTTRSATTTARSGRTTTRSARRRPRPLRLRRGGPPGHRRPARRRRRVRRPPARAVRRLRPRASCRSPAAYPTSCSPQAWAAASPLLWLRTLLGLAPSASNAQVWLAPRLPAAIEHLHVSGIKIGDRRITIDVEGDDVQVDGLDGFQLLTTPRPPLTALVDGA